MDNLYSSNIEDKEILFRRSEETEPIIKNINGADSGDTMSASGEA